MADAIELNGEEKLANCYVSMESHLINSLNLNL
jgi:hypothetical protein